jgi:hypothetical protein
MRVARHLFLPVACLAVFTTAARCQGNSGLGPEVKILIDVHCRFAPSEPLRIANKLGGLDIFWWEEATTVSASNSLTKLLSGFPVATGKQFEKVGQFDLILISKHLEEEVCKSEGISGNFGVPDRIPVQALQMKIVSQRRE